MEQPKPYAVRARNIDPASENKIHDDDVARQFGFSGALVPGVELFAYLTHPLVEAWGEDFLRRGRIDVRFRRPVYDGEQVVATAEPSEDGSVELVLAGPDGVARSVGQAWRVVEAGPAPDGFGDAALPATLPAASPESLRPGPLGTVTEAVDATAAQRYLSAIDESLPLYGDARVVHPGGLLRLVNAILVRNVELGPWIHTASSCRFLDLAPVPTTLVGRARVTDNFERSGHRYVRYDAVVNADTIPVMHVEHTAIYQVASG
jgi:acyl dehydratase